MPRYHVTFEDDSQLLVDAPDEAGVRKHVVQPDVVTRMGEAKTVKDIEECTHPRCPTLPARKLD